MVSTIPDRVSPRLDIIMNYTDGTSLCLSKTNMPKKEEKLDKNTQTIKKRSLSVVKETCKRYIGVEATRLYRA